MPTDYKIWREEVLSPLCRQILERVHLAWREGQAHTREWLEYNLVKQDGAAFTEVSDAFSHLLQQGLIEAGTREPLRPTLPGLLAIAETPQTQEDLDAIAKIIVVLHKSYAPDRRTTKIDQVAVAAGLELGRARRLGKMLGGEIGFSEQEVFQLEATALSWTSFEAFLSRRMRRHREPLARPPTPINIRAEVLSVAFRGLGPYQVGELRIGALTVLVGANATGKTSALRALALVRELATHGLPGVSAHDDLLRANDQRMHLSVTADLIRPSAPSERIEWTIELGLHGRPHVAHEEFKRLGPHPATMARFELGVGAWCGPRDELVPLAMSPDSLALIAARDPEHQYGLLALRQALTKWVVLLEKPPRRKPPLYATSPEEPAWKAIVGHDGAWKAFEASVHSVAGIAGLHVVGDQLVVEEIDHHRIEIDRVSAGLYRVIDILARAHAPEPPPLLAIDEIENHIHADMAGRLMDVLRGLARRTQVVLTTHSGRILQNVVPAEVLWVRRGPRGSEIVPVANDPAMAKLLVRHDLAELALGGYFGARL